MSRLVRLCEAFGGVEKHEDHTTNDHERDDHRNPTDDERRQQSDDTQPDGHLEPLIKHELAFFKSEMPRVILSRCPVRCGEAIPYPLRPR